MKSACLAVILVAASATASSAGTYVGLGVGSSASIGGDSTAITSDGGRSGRLIVGQSFGRLSIEGAGTRYGAFYQKAGYDGTALAIAARLTFPVSGPIALFGRGGLQRTWLSTSRANMTSFSGNGYLLGAGVEYDFHVSVLGGGAIFADYERADSTFQGSAGRSFDFNASMWTLGVTLSL
jgi:hypothetical protein